MVRGQIINKYWMKNNKMTVSKESHVDLQERFEKISKLLKEVDPESTPYASKYLAKQELLNLRGILNDLLSKHEDEAAKLNGMLAATIYYLGSVGIDTEEVTNGQQYLLQCKDLIEKEEKVGELALVYQMTLNQLGILFAGNDPQKSLSYIVEAEKVYEQFKNTKFLEISDLFARENKEYGYDKALKTFEKNYTLTLYYKAQIYGALKDALKSSVYCHVTLQRQLESEDYDHIDWALNAATLSQFFMEQNGFKQARHHLAASLYILDKYEANLNEINDHTPEYDAKVETFKHRSADVARCFAKYGLLLLSVSRERLMKHADDLDTNCTISSDLSKLKLERDSSVSFEDLQHLDFPTLDLSSYESQVTDQFALTAADARSIFTNIENWLNKALEYYTLDNLASDYIEIIQDKSQMYSRLAFFESNPDNQAKLQKRRADLLEKALNAINPSYYMQYCRQLWFELAEIYSDILDIKREKLQECQDRPTPHALTKINSLVEKSIGHFKNFINSFKNLATDKFPKTIAEDFEKPFLLAHIHIGALCGRYIVLNKEVKGKYIRESLEMYKMVVDYCDRNPKAVELIRLEYPMCKEMVELLPFKILNLE